MLIPYEQSSLNLIAVLNKLNEILGTTSITSSYTAVDEEGVPTVIEVDSKPLVDSNINKTTMLSRADVENILSTYVDVTKQFAVEKNVDPAKMTNEMVVLKPDGSIYTKNSSGEAVTQVDKDALTIAAGSYLTSGDVIIGNGVPDINIGVNGTIYIDKQHVALFMKIDNVWENMVEESVPTEAPILGNAVDMMEKTTQVIGILNYNNSLTYYLDVTSGTAYIDSSNGSIVYEPGDVNGDINVTIKLSAMEAGKAISPVVSVSFLVIDVPVRADGVITNINLLDNAANSVGITF